MRVVIYCRVATVGQAETNPLKDQEQRLRAFAEAAGHDVVGCICETGSGLSLDRPGIRDIRRMAAGGEMDAVLALSLSCLARNTADLLTLGKALQENGVGILTAKEGAVLGPVT